MGGTGDGGGADFHPVADGGGHPPRVPVEEYLAGGARRVGDPPPRGRSSVEIRNAPRGGKIKC